jgi:hypothetical protein
MQGRASEVPRTAIDQGLGFSVCCCREAEREGGREGGREGRRETRGVAGLGLTVAVLVEGIAADDAAGAEGGEGILSGESAFEKVH